MAPSERSVRNAEPSTSSSLREYSHDDVTDSADAIDKGENSNETLRSRENLDEIEAPKPVALRERRGGLEERLEEEHLAEERRRRSSAQTASQTTTPVPPLVDNLDELAAEAGATQSRNDADEKDTLEERRKGRLGAHKLRKEWLELLYTLSYLIFFSLLGTLARLGLQSLTIYPGAPVALGELWANVAGTAVIGFLSEDRALFSRDLRARASPNLSRDALRKEHLAIKKTIPLYIGLTVGFCGSFTTFSSFMRDAFLALSDDLAIPSSSDSSSSSSLRRNDGRSVEALLAVLILETATCLTALDFGAHVALAAEPLLTRLQQQQRRSFAFRSALDPAAVVLGPGCWLGAVLLAIWPPHARWRGDAVFALVFAPLGTLARFWLALRLNARVPAFPLGTFAANVLGTLVLAGAWDVQRAGALAVGAVGCQVLRGVMDGFCGCLTTVSTWVLEMKGMGRRRHAYAYGVGSLGVGVAVVVVVMGSLRWTEGFNRARCGS